MFKLWVPAIGLVTDGICIDTEVPVPSVLPLGAGPRSGSRSACPARSARTGSLLHIIIPYFESVVKEAARIRSDSPPFLFYYSTPGSYGPIEGLRS